MKLKCKECPFNSGAQCHGHGEYFNECDLLNLLCKIQKVILQNKTGKFANPKDPYETFIIKDEDECKFLDFNIW